MESIEGIDPKRVTAIMQCYGNLEKIAAADPQDMAERCKLTASDTMVDEDEPGYNIGKVKDKRTEKEELLPCSFF